MKYLPNQTQFDFEGVKMKTYEVAVPITGWQVFRVEACSPEGAIDRICDGEVDTDEFDDIKWDLDKNNWDIEEVESDE